MEKIFLSLHRYLKKRRITFFIFFFLLTGLLAWMASSINLKEDVSDFMPDSGEAERINFVNNNIALSEKIIINLSNADTSVYADEGDLCHWADILADSIISKGAGNIKDIFYKVNDEQTLNIGSFILRNLPYYLDESDYAHIDSVITPENIKKTLENDRKVLSSPAGYAIKKMLTYDPLHLSGKALNRLTAFQVDKVYNIENGYILSKDRKSLFIFVSSINPVSETSKNKELVKAIKTSFEDVVKEADNTIRISSFGAVDVAVTNASQIRKDSYFSILISVCLILIVLGLYFKKPAPLFMIVFPVVFGGIFSIALLCVFKGTISSIAIGAGSAIFGIAINYSLHFFVHLKSHGGIESTINDLSSPMITGSITTVGAFLSLMVLSSESLHDFGLFAALTLIGSLLFVLIVLPLIPGLEKISPSVEMKGKLSVWERMSEYRPENKKYLILATVVLTIILAFFSGSVKFDSDLNQINYMTPEQRRSFKELSAFTTLSRQTTYLITEGKDPNSALRSFERNKIVIDSLAAAGKIKGYLGVGTGLLSDSLQKIKSDQWNSFWETRRSLTTEYIKKYSHEAGFSDESFKPFIALLDSTFYAQPFEHFQPLSESLFNDLIIDRQGRSMIVTLIYTDPKNPFDPGIITSEHSDTFVYDRKNIADTLVALLMSDFNKVLWICGLIVIVFLTISFGRLELSLIAFAPMAISWIWILGIMSLFGISFNVVNVILATFIFGLGDDYSIFITEGLMKDYSHKTKMLNSYKSAVLLSALTMFIGIGTLIFARHPAMKSLAVVTIIGMTSVVIISFITAPYLFNALIRIKGKNRLMPVTFRNFFITVYAFTFFLFGSLLLTISGFILLKICKPSQKNKLKFHKHLSSLSRFVVKHMPRVKTEVVNNLREDFSKPAIIISNHQAHIDLVYIMMLSPKIIILTNDWVWNSPFYGMIVKYADFYPIADGVESSVEKLSELVANGYSILVFPEGTRSEDCSIKRFHKGAFYLAEKLELDIIPVIIHGMGHCLPKKELLLRKGRCTVKICDRIPPSDISFGSDYVERSKNLRRFLINEYNNLAERIETSDYFKDRVFHNYIYKGPSVERQAVKTLRHESANEVISVLPDKGNALFVNSDFGTLALLAALVKKQLTIDAFEEDNEKRILSENCISKPSNLTYLNSLQGETKEHTYDAIVWQCENKKSTTESITNFLEQNLVHTDNLIIVNLNAKNKKGNAYNGWEMKEVGKFAQAYGYSIIKNEAIFILKK